MKSLFFKLQFFNESSFEDDKVLYVGGIMAAGICRTYRFIAFLNFDKFRGFAVFTLDFR